MASGSKVLRFPKSGSSGHSSSSGLGSSAREGRRASAGLGLPGKASPEAVWATASPSGSGLGRLKRKIKPTSRTNAARPPSAANTSLGRRCARAFARCRQAPSAAMSLPVLDGPPRVRVAATGLGDSDTTGAKAPSGASSGGHHSESRWLTSSTDWNRSSGFLAIIFRQIVTSSSGTPSRSSEIPRGSVV